MLEVVRQDYIQSARAKGLAEGVVIGKHALRNALLPIVTILGLSLPGLIGGSVIIESIFAIPGMGQLMVQAVFERDYPVIMGNLVIVSLLTLGANLVADLTYGLVDPRIRVAARGAAGERVRSFWRALRRNQLALAGGVVVVFVAVLALLAPVIAPMGPESVRCEEDSRRALRPPSARHRSAGARCSLPHALRRARVAGGGLRVGGHRDGDRDRAGRRWPAITAGRSTRW